MSLNLLKKLLAGLSLLACSSAFAGSLTVDLSNINSVGEFGNARNTVLTFDVGANSHITNVNYSINVTAFDPSFLAELGLAFSNSTVTEGVLLTPGAFDMSPGTASYSDTLDLILSDLDFTVGADGILRLEFYEVWDDGRVTPDGFWNFGSITFGYDALEDPADVPEPASALLVASGIAALGVARRRRAGRVMH